MNKYRFALLRYLMGAINAVSPNARIENNSLHYAVNKTDRKVYDLNIKSLATKLAADGWECILTEGHLEATASRKDFNCCLTLVAGMKQQYYAISTWAYKKAK